MKPDLLKASQSLSRLELKMSIDNVLIDVLWFRIMCSRADLVIKRHTHSSFEFHFIKSGACRVLHDQGEFIAGPGDFYLTAPQVYHEQYALAPDGYMEYSINCDISPMDDTDTEALQIYKLLSGTPCMPYRDSSGSIRNFDKALEEAYYKKPGFFNTIKSLAVLIIFSAARSIYGKSPVCPTYIPSKKSKDDYRLQLIHRFIEDNIQYPISTGDIASHLFLSDKQVCRIVREKDGMSTKDLINRIKFKKAKELLSETDLSVKEISAHLGFSSEYYFSQFFKREEGFPPITFRKNVQKP